MAARDYARPPLGVGADGHTQPLRCQQIADQVTVRPIKNLRKPGELLNVRPTPNPEEAVCQDWRLTCMAGLPQDATTTRSLDHVEVFPSLKLTDSDSDLLLAWNRALVPRERLWQGSPRIAMALNYCDVHPQG
jgi:hypothetical protein